MTVTGELEISAANLIELLSVRVLPLAMTALKRAPVSTTTVPLALTMTLYESYSKPSKYQKSTSS